MKAGFLIGIDNRGTHWYCNLIYNTNEVNLRQKLVIYIDIVIIENARESTFFGWQLLQRDPLVLYSYLQYQWSNISAQTCVLMTKNVFLIIAESLKP